MFKIDTSTSAALGIAFLLIGTGNTFFMFWLWGFPFDKASKKSAAPKSLMYLHRAIGFVFIALYVFMMIQMVPRLVRYQVEFPARTVVHMCLGITIGFFLVLKVAIIRFFRHLEEWMPFLGTAILLCTWLLSALSVPSSFRERQLAGFTPGKGAFAPANLERVKAQLPNAGLPAEAPLADLSSTKELTAGRQVLLTRCTQCHDLRTVLTRPRMPDDWWRTVDRMSQKPVFGDEIPAKEQYEVTAYLIAISPQLQLSAQKARAQKESAISTKKAAREELKEDEATDTPKPDTTAADPTAADPTDAPKPVKPPEKKKKPIVDASVAKPIFQKKCSACHETSDVASHHFKDERDVDKTLTRMIDNGLEATPAELAACRSYVVATYLKGGG